MKTKQEILLLVGNLATAATNHYQVVNGDKRGSAAKASQRELAAATKLVKALTSEEVTETEIINALGW